ncbi:beta-lactamase superfamily domain-containing protein [Cyathus striatus]|nr:beta-lactamase superfamily domain-containing protein [Cyathus striatus]
MSRVLHHKRPLSANIPSPPGLSYTNPIPKALNFLTTMARVLDIDAKRPKDLDASGKPTHWDNLKGKSFHNPWPSWKDHSIVEKLGMITKIPSLPSPPTSSLASEHIKVRKPTWGKEFLEEEKRDGIQTTWISHACFLVEFPSRSEVGRGMRMLFDPVFNHRCSPVGWFGPKRYTPPACVPEDIPSIDAVVISHNHYDHLETSTIRTLHTHHPEAHFFAPIGNEKYFSSLGIPSTHFHTLDWWDSKRLEVELGEGEGKRKRSVELTLTPAQHNTGRLWGTWVLEEILPDSAGTQNSTPKKLFFAGDTGYRSVMDGEDEDEVARCPAFKQIGETFGGVDVALVPIGAYEPRQFMSRMHASPQDSAQIFLDVRARKGLGMHWGTYLLTWENQFDAPAKLAEACRKYGIEEGVLGVCEVGETRLF